MSQPADRFLRALSVTLAGHAVALGLAYVGWWFHDRVDPPPCYGLGWGCELDPGAAVLITGVVLTAPVVVVSVVLLLVGRTLAPRDQLSSGRASKVLLLLPQAFALLAATGGTALAIAGLVEWVRA